MTEDPAVVLVGDYDYSYPREKQFRDGLELNGVDVLACRFNDEELMPGPKKLLLLPLFYVRVWRRMREIRAETDEVDAVVLTRFNVLLLPLAFLYARRFGCPLVYDLFVSLYRTAEMRGSNRLLVGAVRVLETALLRLPTHLTVGTNQLIELYVDLYSLPGDRFVRVPPGADEIGRAHV